MKAKYILSGRGLAIALTCLILCLGLLSAASALGAIPTVAQTLPPTTTALPPTTTPMPVTTEEMRLTEEDNGSRFLLSQGQAFLISLEGNPSTGYTWEIAEIDEEVLRQVGEIEFEPKSDLLGAPGKQILRFEAVGSGQSTLKLVYRRPWERGVEPAKEFSVQVVGRTASTGTPSKELDKEFRYVYKYPLSTAERRTEKGDR